MERHFLCIFSHSSATWCPIEDLDPAQIYLPKTTFAFLACRISVGKRLSRVICYAEWFSVFPSWILPAEYDPVTWPKIRFLFKKAIQFSQHKNISSKNTFRDEVQSRGHPSQIFFRNQFAWTVSAHNAIPINKNRSLSSQSSQAKQNLFDCSNIQPHRTSPGPFLVRSSIWPMLSKSFLRKNQSTTFFEKRNKTSVKLILRNRTPVGQ